MFRYWRAQPLEDYLKWVLSFCVMLNTTFSLILELNACFLALLGCRALSVESERRWRKTWT